MKALASKSKLYMEQAEAFHPSIDKRCLLLVILRLCTQGLQKRSLREATRLTLLVLFMNTFDTVLIFVLMKQELFQGAIAVMLGLLPVEPKGMSVTLLLACSSLSALPECSGECLAGQKDLGYLYAAVHDPLLAEVCH